MHTRCLLSLLLFIAAASSAATPDAPREVLFVLMRDAAATTERAALAARVATFGHHAKRMRESLRGALPSTLAHAASFEALPALNAWLVSLPPGSARSARRALAAQSSVAEVAVHGTAETQAGAPDLTPPAPELAAATLTLGLIDHGVDASHPYLAAALGRLHFQPGTPGAGADGRLLRSHGTAMAGVIAQLVQGEALTSDGVVQSWLTLPQAIPLNATLVAHAGPETRAGRSALVRALNWMMLPGNSLPQPDVINYSQGNGRLCKKACARRHWTAVTRAIDRLVDEQGVVFVKSAGNHGFDADTTMTVPGDTWNGITVGNMHAFDWQRCRAGSERATHRIYHTSSVAPTASTSRLLDLVAPGVRIGTTGVDPAYCRRVCVQHAEPRCTFCARLGAPDPVRKGHWKVNSGTSPAAAIVSAVALSLIDAGLRDPRAVKAVLINSADAWTSDGAPPPRTRGEGRGCTDDPAAARHGPYRYGSHYDRSYGYGYLNPAQAIAMRPHTTLATVTADHPHCYATHLEAWDKLTLIWHRHVGDGSGLPLSPLRLTLLDAADHSRLDGDDAPRLDNVRQVSNGRGANAEPRARDLIVRVDAAASERYALASARRLEPLPACP